MNSKKAVIWTVTACFLLIIAIAGIVLSANYTLKMQQIEKTTFYAEAGEELKLPSAEAFFKGNLFFRDGFFVDAAWEGEVDTQKAGSYEIACVARYWDYVESVPCTVIVQDTKAPVITLVSNPSHTTLPGYAYEEEGFTATDAADGDLTHLVERREENGKVIYTVQDAAGNVTQVERTIQYEDDIAPVLTLKGSSTINLSVGELFTDPGFTATDNGVIDMTSRVTVSCNDKYFAAGTYTITYTVEDDFGNKATASRTLKVKSVGNGKVIYLTFDDGPGQYTEQLLDILDKYNVKATFFVVTDNNKKYMPLLKRMDASGHSIGLHTDSHDYYKIYASEENYYEDLEVVRQQVYEQIGYYPNILRFPGGSSNPISKKICKGIMTKLAASVQEKGYRYFDWNVNTHDAEGKEYPAEAVLAYAMEGCQKYDASYVLMHDIMKKTISIIEEFIVWALDNGYTFLPITDSTHAYHHRIQN